MIAANRYGWTDKLKGKFGSVRAEVEPGAKRFFCFPAGTLVRMSDGSTRPIEQVKAQDVVMSRDEETGQTGKQKVTQLFRHVAARALRLRLSSGEQIEATPEHPFYVQDKGFRPAKVLAAGMILVTLSQLAKVEAVTPVEQSATVYNFAVEW